VRGHHARLASIKGLVPRTSEKNLIWAYSRLFLRNRFLLVHSANLPIKNKKACRLREGDLTTAVKDMARKTKILLVDDSKFLRLATERALARAGYEVSTAGDGVRALQIAREKKPDLILLDMLLPKMTGPDVLKALKKDPATAGIAVVVFTGLSHKNAARLQQDGAYAFLDKAELELDKGSETLLTALAGIVRKLNLEVPELTTL
jgi:CheY-like chemotaxis protein